MPTNDELRTLQALPLDIKILKTKQRIKEWYDHWDGQVYISFSGGKDSTVLLDIARSIYPDIPAVFIDTGLEYPEIRSFVKTFDNVTWVKPEMNFKKVLEHYGYPFFSKEISNNTKGAKKYVNYVYKRAEDNNLEAPKDMNDLEAWAQLIKQDLGKVPGSPHRLSIILGILGYNNEISTTLTPDTRSYFKMDKWKFLLDSKTEFSDECCDVMKKRPAKKYTKESGRKPYIASMTAESNLRRQKWLEQGCNAFTGKNIASRPMSFWTEQDVLTYIKLNNLPIASVYGEIVNEKDQVSMLPDETPRLKTTGCSRTGCVYCGFGCHLEKEENSRFLRLKETHPQIYDYIMKPTDQGGLGYKEIIDWLNEHGNLHIRY